MKPKKYIVDMKINTRPAPPSKPSTVLFGLILGNSGVLPRLLPTK